MKKEVIKDLPNQTKLNNSVKTIPIEFFEWGKYPDHFKIDMPHRHQFSELLFMTKGSGVHEIDYRDHKIQQGSIHYIPKSTVHFLKRSKDSEGFTIAFDDKYFERNDKHKFINPLKMKSFKLDLKEKTFKGILDQSNLVLTQINQDESYYKQKCFLLSIELLLCSIASEISNENDLLEDEPESELVRNFIYLVKTNIHKEHSVAWYAEQLMVSSKTLGNQAKKSLGISPKIYIHQVLLSSVKRSLIDSNKSIKEIALDHNYDLSQLGKLFKKNVSFTMKAYRS